jgi:aryl-alcohol dehydrogenase-like predicted oxidoreductase
VCETSIVQNRGIGGPQLGFGCVRLGSVSGGRSWRSDVRLVRDAVDAGVALFDTADAYGNGVSEQIVGRALRHRRGEVEIATKVGYRFTPRSLPVQTALRLARPVVGQLRRRSAGTSNDTSAPTTSGSYADQDFSASYLRSAVEASLRRLRTDHIDVVQLHGPPSLLPDLLGELGELVTAGKVRRLGVGSESVASALEWVSADHVDVVQAPFGVLDPQAADRVLPTAAGRDVRLWARGAFGGGLLGAAVAERASGPPAASARSASERHPKWAFVSDFIDFADDAGMTPFELAADYVRSFSEVSALVIGIHSPQHLAENLRLMRRPLPSQDLVERVGELIARWVDDRELR